MDVEGRDVRRFVEEEIGMERPVGRMHCGDDRINTTVEFRYKMKAARKGLAMINCFSLRLNLCQF